MFLHASGGTTDLLTAEKDGSGSYKLTEIGGSIDLHAGQFIDRIGVSLGLQFPAGPALEKFAGTAAGPVELPVPLKAAKQAFQGLQLRQNANWRQGKTGRHSAWRAKVLAETFYRLIYNACSEYNTKSVLIAGGVASNTYIREYLHNKLTGRKYHFGTLRHALAAIMPPAVPLLQFKG